MKSRLALVMIAAAMFAAAGSALAAPAWQYVRSIGTWQFAVVDPAAADNATVLMQAAQSLCAQSKACVVVFWADAAFVPLSMPMTRAQRRAVVAQYTRNSATGVDELLLRCKANQPATARCLR